MPTCVAINGFGRVGRAVLRSAIEREAELDLVAVNDVADADTLAHLLTLDSVYGRPEVTSSMPPARSRALSVEGSKRSRADDANPCMTSTHPSVARLTLAVPFP